MMCGGTAVGAGQRCNCGRWMEGQLCWREGDGPEEINRHGLASIALFAVLASEVKTRPPTWCHCL